MRRKFGIVLFGVLAAAVLCMALLRQSKSRLAQPRELDSRKILECRAEIRSLRLQPGQKQFVYVTITNRAEESLYIAPPWTGNVQMQATRDGKKVTSLINRMGIINGTMGYSELLAGQAAVFRVDLSPWFNFEDPGQYEIQAIYSVTPFLREKEKEHGLPGMIFTCNVSFTVQKTG